MPVPRVHQQFRDLWERRREEVLVPYLSGQASFVPNLLPELAVQLTVGETLRILRLRLGEAVDQALVCTDPEMPAGGLPASIQSPVAGQPDGSWLKQVNMVGINVRTIGTFWNVVSYMLTVPAAVDAVHLLPIWEPGVVGSLYGMSSWQINDEFYSPELAAVCPAADTVAKQLKLVVNLLHAMGRAVGMDVIPHTDRYSEIVLAHPQYFEWLQREGTEIVDHAENLHQSVQVAILEFLEAHGPALSEDEVPNSPEMFFSEGVAEARRLRILFGLPEDRTGREARRQRLVGHLHAYGYEPVPATMAPPYRGLVVDVNTRYTDSQGNVWYDYRIAEPQPMSRVFGPLARYKLYGSHDDNRNWALDFDRPLSEVWRYVSEHYFDVQRRFGFDFMRGDMSHVQMRPEGVPGAVDEHYDILRAVKNHIQTEHAVRHFGYFAETFLAARNVMGYGDEVDHLEASEADSTLGDLQSTSVGSPVFLQRLRQYHDLLVTRSFAPSFTVITGDKDDPRFDEFYLRGNALRLFLALFLTDMPSYVALGFETRDPHPSPAPNEHYTKLYVFQERTGPKATFGPYVWGKNGALFRAVTDLRLFAEQVLPMICGRPSRWVIPPDPTGEGKHLAWTQGGGRAAYLFVANTDTGRPVHNVHLPRLTGLADGAQLVCEFSTEGVVPSADQVLVWCGRGWRAAGLAAAEGRAYRIVG